jgi:TonB family protein
METVGPQPVDDELHLLTEWGDPAARSRSGRAGVISLLVHAVAILLLAVLPEEFFFSNPPPPESIPTRKIVTPLIEPLTEFTQPAPNKGKIAKSIDMASLEPRKAIKAPPGPPSTSRPVAPRPAVMPTPPAPPPPAASLPEPPKIEVAVKEPPKLDQAKLDLPVTNSNLAPPPVPTVEKPKMVLENVGGPPAPVPASQRKIAIPGTSVSDAIRETVHGAQSGGIVVGDPGAGSGGVGGGVNLPPSPGAQGSALELKSDPMGVDFRPYLTQILATIRRNWYAVMPQSVKLGQRGKVGLLFAITKTGSVSKVTWAFQSGAEALDKAAVAAISASNPFPPLPAEYKGERVVLQLNFAYNAPKQ